MHKLVLRARQRSALKEDKDAGDWGFTADIWQNNDRALGLFKILEKEGYHT